MTLIELAIQWNNAWRYDRWWREKHNIAFGSEAHRGMTPLDIKFEYVEDYLAKKQTGEFEANEAKTKALKEGRWIEENIDQEKQDMLWDKIDLSKLV